MILQESETSKLRANLRAESDVSHLLIKNPLTMNDTMQPIAEVEIKPKELAHVSLGNYTSTNTPKGFLVYIDLQLAPESTSQQITSLKKDDAYELVLHIVNCENETVNVEIWQI